MNIEEIMIKPQWNQSVLDVDSKDVVSSHDNVEIMIWKGRGPDKKHGEGQREFGVLRIYES